MANKDYIKTIASEFKGDEKKLLEKIADEKFPDFSPREEFKEKLDAKIKDKIRTTKEQKADQATMDAVPRKLKWRFYLTGYGYAVVSFVALFLIGFCTNIFTGTLNVPAKYTYLDESKAFGNLDKGEDLAYGYGKDTVSNYAYYDEDVEYDVEESLDADDDATINANKSMKKNSFTRNMPNMNKEMATMTATENLLFDDGGGEENFNLFSFGLNNFVYNQTYRFAYKDKLFPKLATEYPIYKASGILMGSNTPNQVLKNLKIGDVSFKNFQDLEIASLYIEQNTENGYSISFDSRSQTLSFYPNDTRQAKEYSNKLPSKKQIAKAVEKDLKELGVSTKNYGDIEINIEKYDESMGIVNVFYPLNFQGKEVRNPEMNERIGMQIDYDLNLQKTVSVVGIDIATYDISKYPTLDKSYIEKEIEKGGEFFDQGALHENSTVILFDNMEIIYIPKYTNGTTYYVPAIKGETNPSIENYRGPKYVFQEIVK